MLDLPVLLFALLDGPMAKFFVFVKKKKRKRLINAL